VKGSGRVECLSQIGEDVVDMLDPDRQAHIAGGDPGGGLFLGRQLRMGGRGRVNGKAACVTDIGDVIEQCERVDEPLSRFQSARQFETDKAAGPA
jgi:hypothetical protein